MLGNEGIFLLADFFENRSNLYVFVILDFNKKWLNLFLLCRSMHIKKIYR